jgi:hypothetical protein
MANALPAIRLPASTSPSKAQSAPRRSGRAGAPRARRGAACGMSVVVPATAVIIAATAVIIAAVLAAARALSRTQTPDSVGSSANRPQIAGTNGPTFEGRLARGP